MWYNLLSSTVEKTRNATLGEAALYALMGFAIVFIGIAFLIFIVWLVGKVMTKTTKSVEPKKTEPTPKPTPVASVVEEELSDEVVAVIMAALTAYYQQNNPKCEFTVKRIKRI